MIFLKTTLKLTWMSAMKARVKQACDDVFSRNEHVAAEAGPAPQEDVPLMD